MFTSGGNTDHIRSVSYRPSVKLDVSYCDETERKIEDKHSGSGREDGFGFPNQVLCKHMTFVRDLCLNGGVPFV